MYDYSRQIYEYLQTHIPSIESLLSEIRLAVVSLGNKVFPALALISVLLLVDRLIKRGDLI